MCSVLTRFSLTVKLVQKIMSLLLTCAQGQNMTHMYFSVVVTSQYCAMCQKICKSSDPTWDFHIPS